MTVINLLLTEKTTFKFITVLNLHECCRTSFWLIYFIASLTTRLIKECWLVKFIMIIFWYDFVESKICNTCI